MGCTYVLFGLDLARTCAALCLMYPVLRYKRGGGNTPDGGGLFPTQEVPIIFTATEAISALLRVYPLWAVAVEILETSGHATYLPK